MKLPPRNNVSVERPLLNYYGGKWRLAPWTISLMPAHLRYVEPFGGGGSILLQKQRSNVEVYNDIWGEVVNLFKTIRDFGNQLSCAVENTPCARDEFNLAYEKTEDNIESARRMLIRSFFGFSGVATYYNTSSFTPGTRHESRLPGAEVWRRFPEHLKTISERLRGVVIENRSFEEILERYNCPQTLIYVDPPYVSTSRKSTEVYFQEFSDADHELLASILNKSKAKIMLAGYRSELYDRLYSDWRCEERVAFDGRSNKRVECIWMKNILSSQGTLL